MKDHKPAPFHIVESNYYTLTQVAELHQVYSQTALYWVKRGWLRAMVRLIEAVNVQLPSAGQREADLLRDLKIRYQPHRRKMIVELPPRRERVAQLDAAISEAIR